MKRFLVPRDGQRTWGAQTKKCNSLEFLWPARIYVCNSTQLCRRFKHIVLMAHLTSWDAFANLRGEVCDNFEVETRLQNMQKKSILQIELIQLISTMEWISKKRAFCLK